jgi:hypothetical protein
VAWIDNAVQNAEYLLILNKFVMRSFGMFHV